MGKGPKGQMRREGRERQGSREDRENAEGAEGAELRGEEMGREGKRGEGKQIARG